ncbi:hypothetical protein, partial [Salmonella sp. SAL04286]|uniref:hypothetical protein n=1 Tax=Salmonella sp. SAL04286 TaxID=3159864 RepID=UPI00397E4849
DEEVATHHANAIRADIAGVIALRAELAAKVERKGAAERRLAEFERAYQRLEDEARGAHASLATDSARVDSAAAAVVVA